MIDHFQKKIEDLVKSLLEPVLSRIFESSWKVRTLALAIIVAGGTTYVKPDIARNAYASAQRTLRLVQVEDAVIPIPAELIDSIKGAQSRLRLSVEKDVSQLGSGFITPWSAAQAASALVEAPNGLDYAKRIASFIRESSANDCKCWSETPPHQVETAWLFISGWVYSAFADFSIPVTAEETQFVLDRQSDDGWWPSTARTASSEYASTYATAWIIIGLKKQVTSGLIDSPERRAVIERAISRGASWLLANRVPKARWKPYPNLKSSSVSGSVSGVVLHALHLTLPDQVAYLDEEWIDNLPEAVIPASLGENSYVEIKADGGVQIDHFVQLRMPWMLIATVDAYKNVPFLKKLRALSWIENEVSHESVANADAEQNNWWRAELLIWLD